MRTLDPPGAPSTPTLVSRTADALTLSATNPGLVSDPAATGLLLEVDGTVLPPTAGVSDDGGRTVTYVLAGLGEWSTRTVRARCTVVDAEVDAGLEWSPPLVARTRTREEVSGICFCSMLAAGYLLELTSAVFVLFYCVLEAV